MRSRVTRRWIGLGALALVVVLTRLPWLGAGYGLHADNWRVALAARHIAETGVYEASRLPGYPVQECVCSLFWKCGPWGLNLLDALACAVACMLFARICLLYGMEGWMAWLTGLTLAFVPVLYVNSVSAKDFPWALALVLGSWLCAMRGSALKAGLLLGLAMGCRVTSGAAALPLALVLTEGLENQAAMRRVAMAGAAAAAVAVAVFVPVYWRYGWDFFDFYPDHAFPDVLEIARRMTVEVWGVIGFAGLCVALAAAVRLKGWRRVHEREAITWGSMVGIYGAAFFCLPDEAAYLIPAAPFVLLLLWRIAPRRGYLLACAAVLASPFVTVGPHGPGAGLLIEDHRQRVATDGAIGAFLDFADKVPGRNAYIVGGWEPEIAVRTEDAPREESMFLYLVTLGELKQLEKEGWRVWYLPMMREFEARVYQYDVAKAGALDVRGAHAAVPLRAGDGPRIR